MNQYQKLVDNLTKLNLDNMAASIADYRQQVNDNQISFSEALLELTDKEIAYQQQKSLKRRIKRARFPIIKLLSDFDYQFQPSINQQQIAEFATMSFLDNQENIDELGYLPISAEEAKLLFQLINGRYERKSTIITTNVPLSSWGAVLHSTATAEAILDRLVYHSHVIKIKGKSYRLASVNS